MICSVTLSYWEYASKWHPERLKLLREYLDSVGITPPAEDDEVGKPWFDQVHQLNIIDLADRRLPFAVKESHAIKGSFEGQVAQYLQRLHEKISIVKTGQRETHLHIESSGDSWLHQVNDVRVDEDCCTDDLRRLLDEGWRIVAICPQPRSRRPDYVLGRIKPSEGATE